MQADSQMLSKSDGDVLMRGFKMSSALGFQNLSPTVSNAVTTPAGRWNSRHFDWIEPGVAFQVTVSVSAARLLTRRTEQYTTKPDCYRPWYRGLSVCL